MTAAEIPAQLYTTLSGEPHEFGELPHLDRRHLLVTLELSSCEPGRRLVIISGWQAAMPGRNRSLQRAIVTPAMHEQWIGVFHEWPIKRHDRATACSDISLIQTTRFEKLALG